MPSLCVEGCNNSRKFIDGVCRGLSRTNLERKYYFLDGDLLFGFDSIVEQVVRSQVYTWTVASCVKMSFRYWKSEKDTESTYKVYMQFSLSSSSLKVSQALEAPLTVNDLLILLDNTDMKEAHSSTFTVRSILRCNNIWFELEKAACVVGRFQHHEASVCSLFSSWVFLDIAMAVRTTTSPSDISFHDPQGDLSLYFLSLRYAMLVFSGIITNVVHRFCIGWISTYFEIAHLQRTAFCCLVQQRGGYRPELSL